MNKIKKILFIFGFIFLVSSFSSFVLAMESGSKKKLGEKQVDYSFDKEKVKIQNLEDLKEENKFFEEINTEESSLAKEFDYAEDFKNSQQTKTDLKDKTINEESENLATKEEMGTAKNEEKTINKISGSKKKNKRKNIILKKQDKEKIKLEDNKEPKKKLREEKKEVIKNFKKLFEESVVNLSKTVKERELAKFFTNDNKKDLINKTICKEESINQIIEENKDEKNLMGDDSFFKLLEDIEKSVKSSKVNIKKDGDWDFYINSCEILKKMKKYLEDVKDIEEAKDFYCRIFDLLDFLKNLVKKDKEKSKEYTDLAFCRKLTNFLCKLEVVEKKENRVKKIKEFVKYLSVVELDKTILDCIKTNKEKMKLYSDIYKNTYTQKFNEENYLADLIDLQFCFDGDEDSKIFCGIFKNKILEIVFYIQMFRMFITNDQGDALDFLRSKFFKDFISRKYPSNMLEFKKIVSNFSITEAFERYLNLTNLEDRLVYDFSKGVDKKMFHPLYFRAGRCLNRFEKDLKESVQMLDEKSFENFKKLAVLLLNDRFAIVEEYLNSKNAPHTEINKETRKKFLEKCLDTLFNKLTLEEYKKWCKNLKIKYSFNDSAIDFSKKISYDKLDENKKEKLVMSKFNIAREGNIKNPVSFAELVMLNNIKYIFQYLISRYCKENGLFYKECGWSVDPFIDFEKLRNSLVEPTIKNYFQTPPEFLKPFAKKADFIFYIPEKCYEEVNLKEKVSLDQFLKMLKEQAAEHKKIYEVVYKEGEKLCKLVKICPKYFKDILLCNVVESSKKRKSFLDSLLNDNPNLMLFLLGSVEKFLNFYADYFVSSYYFNDQIYNNYDYIDLSDLKNFNKEFNLSLILQKDKLLGQEGKSIKNLYYDKEIGQLINKSE